jgi:histone-lysine N-methyltransferase ASH1L
MTRSSSRKAVPSPSPSASTPSRDDGSSSAPSTQTEASSVSSVGEVEATPRKGSRSPSKPKQTPLRTMRARGGAIVSYNENLLSRVSAGPAEISRTPIKRGPRVLRGARRSTRIVKAEKERVRLAAQPPTVLGKRGADAVTDAKDEPASKKSRLEEEEPVVVAPVKKVFGPKSYMKHGIYIGQDPPEDAKFKALSPEEMRLRGKKAKGRPHALPLPVYAGMRLLDKGRDFKLPFSVYSPIEDRLRRPDKWGKRTTSKRHRLVTEY